MSLRNPLEAQDFIHAKTTKDIDDYLKLLTFPDNFSCYTHTSVEETELIYNEIFVKQEYLLHGLSLENCCCDFDIGANIGLFTIFAKSRNKDIVVHAFEPIRDTYEILIRNIELHKIRDVYPHHNAIGSKDGTERTFTFYPHMAGNSTANPEVKNEQRRVMTELLGKEQTDVFFQSESQAARVRTISSIIEEEGISAIDFLKIDVEGDELAVLKGISKEHFQIIRQVVIEVHSEFLFKEVQSFLNKIGFTVFSGMGLASSAGTGDANIHAVRL